MKLRGLISPLIAGVVLAVPAPVHGGQLEEPDGAQVNPAWSSGISVHGFGEMVCDPHAKDRGGLFRLGQAEIGFESDLSDRTAMGLDVSYTDNAFALGQFVVNWHAWVAPPGGSRTMAGLSSVVLGVGQFDVPFGIDRHEYAAPDRGLISAPAVVTNTHGGWNDIGVYLFVDATWGNVAVFGLNGLCFEGEDCLGYELSGEPELAVGGRIGLTPIERLEVGASFASIEGQAHGLDMELWGADLQIDMARLHVKAEYIAHGLRPRGREAFTNSGFYVQSLYRLSRWYVIGRFGDLQMVGDRDDPSRFSTGLGRSIGTSVQVRVEHQINAHRQNTLLIQSVLVF